MAGVFLSAASDEYKRRADECVRIAQRAANTVDKLTLLNMDKAWRDLATMAESSSKFSLPTTTNMDDAATPANTSRDKP